MPSSLPPAVPEPKEGCPGGSAWGRRRFAHALPTRGNGGAWQVITLNGWADVMQALTVAVSG